MENIKPASMSNRISNSFLSPLLISMVGIVATSLAILFYHFFLIKHCSRRRRGRNLNPAAQPTPPTGGVDQKLLQAIPIFPFSALKCRRGSNKEQDDCAVCLGELEERDMVRLLPNCKHIFHVSCIDQWLASHASCPLCRSPVLKDDGNPPQADSTSGVGDFDCESDSAVAIDRSGGGGQSSSASSSSGVQSFGLLRHCASMVMLQTAESRSSRLINGLKRSLSMDQCAVVAINFQMESEGGNAIRPIDASSILTRGGSQGTRSTNHFDRWSSKFLGSFSRLRLGNRNNVTILPY